MSYRWLWVGVAVEFKAFIEFLHFSISTIEVKECGFSMEFGWNFTTV